MSDLSQVNTNLSALNEKQEKANEIAKGNVSANNENNSVLLSLGQTIESGEQKAAAAISERLGGLKDGIVGLFAGNKENENESRRSFKETMKFIGGKLGDLGKFIGSGFGAAKDKLSEVLGPALFFIKQVVIGGLIFLFFKKLPDILNSPLFQEILNTITTIVIPALQRLYNNFIVPFAKNVGERLVNLFKDINDETKTVTDVLFENAGILSAAVGLLALKFFGVSGIIKGATVAFKGVGLAAGIIKTAFLAIGSKLVILGGVLKAALLPLLPAALPFIAIGAAVVGAFALVITAIQNIRDRFTEGQGFLERIKIIASEIFLSPVRLFQNILGFIAEKLGFENFAAAVADFDPLAFFGQLFTDIGNFFKEKFSLNEKTKEDIAKAGEFVMKIVKAIGNIIMAPFKLLGKIIPDKFKGLFGFGGGDKKDKPVDPFAGQGNTAGGDTSGASIVEDEKRGFFGSLKKHLKVGGETMIKDIFPKAQDFKLFDSAAKKIREDKKLQKQELMDAAYGSANREEFAKQVAAGVLATQGALSVDQSRRSKMSSADIANMQISEFDFSDEMDNLALTNELLKARAAGQVMGSNVSTNVVDNSNNSTTVQEEVILDPKVNDYNFMTSAASDY
tara:strand:- start:828 stop:2693 length:1866 start_codon:yes stop_codon:yes gene_type:complete